MSESRGRCLRRLNGDHNWQPFDCAVFTCEAIFLFSALLVVSFEEDEDLESYTNHQSPSHLRSSSHQYLVPNSPIFLDGASS